MKEKIYEAGSTYNFDFFFISFLQIVQIILIMMIVYYAVRMYRKLDKFLDKRV